jgi:hypothetical protein
MVFCIAAMVAAATLASGRAEALEARVESRGGVPTLLVNGKPSPPVILFHAAGSGATPLRCAVTPEWQEFVVTFRAPVTDDVVALHIRNVAPVGDWYVDDARFYEGTPERPVGGNLIPESDFEAPDLPKDWAYFLNSSTGADAAFTRDTERPHFGQACLHVQVKQVGTEAYHIHIYRAGLRIEEGRTYTFSAWLRASDERGIEMQAIHQGPPWTIYGGTGAPSDELIRFAAERGIHQQTCPTEIPWPKGGKPPDYGVVDWQLRHILDLDPEALIIPRVFIDAPQWWKAEHPDEIMVYDDGKHRQCSPASKPWRRDAAEALRLYVQHLEANFGDHILGYHVGAQSAGEWFYDYTWEPPLPCFEEPFRVGFVEYLRGKYPSESALEEAWGDPQVTFDTVRLPTKQERQEGRPGAFRDPQAQRWVIDFAEYAQVCLCEYLEECARIVKEETQGRKLAVFFYGYLYDMAGFGNGGQVGGHLRLHRALHCPNVDIFCSPISYFDRQSGGTGPFMAPVDSVELHGKLWLNEDDARTHLADATAGYGRTETMAQTLGVYRRNLGHIFPRHAATWWMDFGAGWMNSPVIFDHFAKLRDIYRDRAPTKPYSPQVAIITDEDSFLFLRSSNEVTGPCISEMRAQFERCGAPVGLYLMEDVCEGRLPDTVRLHVFLNAFRVTDAQREQLRSVVSRQGKTALWVYAPGFVNRDASAANIGRLIGMGVAQRTAADLPPIELTEAGKAKLGADPATIGGPRPISPSFAVTESQPGVEVLGRYAGTGEAAIAMKSGGGCPTVFWGGLQVPASALRALARLAGAHVYCDSGDIVGAGPGFVSLHVTTAGQKTISLPERWPAAVDLITGETIARRTNGFTLAMEAGETRLIGRGE